jgi:Tol biopolymer transport system component
MCAVAGCSDSTSPRVNIAIPDFVFVSNQTGRDRLFVFSDGVVTAFPGTMDGDSDPQSAHGRVVFSSYRVSETNSEIYSAKLDGSDLVRLTNNSALDVQPSLSPDGTSVVFVRFQNGLSRLWTMDADGSNATALSTGSDSDVPESLPRFSPDGHTILFNSSRTGTSQLWQMPATGGAAVQLTHETSGAYDGSWSADGSSTFFVAGLDFHTIREISIDEGTVTSYAALDRNVIEPECGAAFCLAVTGSDNSNGDIAALTAANASAPVPLLSSAANEREPAILHP